MKTQALVNFVLSTSLLLTVGCSGLVPSHQTVRISASEPHAKVWVNGMYEGEAPVQVRVRRDEGLGVTVQKQGFHTSNRVVNHHLSTAGAVDVISGCVLLAPFIGLVDPGAQSLDETDLFVQLYPYEQQAAPKSLSPR